MMGARPVLIGESNHESKFLSEHIVRKELQHSGDDDHEPVCMFIRLIIHEAHFIHSSGLLCCFQVLSKFSGK